MKKNWAKKWVKALRSGEFKQGKHKLVENNYHCCLGVLCTLTPYKNNYTKMYSTEGIYHGSSGDVLPDTVKKLVGMKNCTGSLHDNVSLTSFNDNGKSFKWIANYIEKNWKKL